MPKTFRLVFCEFASAHLQEELAYYTEIIGARLVTTGPDGAHYLSLGMDHHNIVLRPATQSGLLSTGFQLSVGVTLEDLEADCTRRKLTHSVKADGRPGVGKFLDVEVGGHSFQFFAEIEAPCPGFSPHGIVPVRLGHVALMSPQAEDIISFFEEVLGCYVTDWFDGLATFLTCNYDHHTVNVISAPPTKLHHIAFELRGGAHQYEASDKLAKASKPIVWGPSRHTAGHNYASYHFDPDHTLVELYTDMDIYVPDGGYFEPRPWHEDLPQRPRVWPTTDFNAWQTEYNFDFTTV